jgi:hypothetical protein
MMEGDQALLHGALTPEKIHRGHRERLAMV